MDTKEERLNQTTSEGDNNNSNNNSHIGENTTLLNSQIEIKSSPLISTQLIYTDPSLRPTNTSERESSYDEEDDEDEDEDDYHREGNANTSEITPEYINSTEGNAEKYTTDFELPSSATILHSPITNSTIILVGSIHIHQNSSDEVSDIIRKWKPDTVFIELCKSRAGLVLSHRDPKKVDLHKERYHKYQQFKNYHISKLHQQEEEFYNRLKLEHQQQQLEEEYSSSTIQDIDINDMTEEDNEVYSNELPPSDDESNELDEVTFDEEEEEEEYDNTYINYNLSYQSNLMDEQGLDEPQRPLSKWKQYNTNSLNTKQEQQPPVEQHIVDLTSSDYADDEKSNSSTPVYTTTPPTPVEIEEQGASLKDMVNIVKRNGLPGLLQILMAEMIRKAGKQSNSNPGTEFITAYLEAKKIGAMVYLGDRLIEITLQRVWNSLSRWEKIKFVYYLFVASLSEVTSQELDDIKNGDDELISQLLDEFKGKFPSVIQTIVTERDQYMAYKLRECPGKKIVAVVGKGHIKGIVREWNNFNININELESVNVQNKKNYYTSTANNHDKNNENQGLFSSLSKWTWATFLIPLASALTLYFVAKKYHFFSWASEK